MPTPAVRSATEAQLARASAAAVLGAAGGRRGRCGPWRCSSGLVALAWLPGAIRQSGSAQCCYLTGGVSQEPPAQACRGSRCYRKQPFGESGHDPYNWKWRRASTDGSVLRQDRIITIHEIFASTVPASSDRRGPVASAVSAIAQSSVSSSHSGASGVVRRQWIALWWRVIANIVVTQAYSAAEPQQKTSDEDYQPANDGGAEVKPDEGRLFHGLPELVQLASREFNCAILGRLLSHCTAASVNSYPGRSPDC